MADTFAERFTSDEVATLLPTDAFPVLGDRLGTPVAGMAQFTAMQNMLGAINAGTVGVGTTAVERGDGYNHVTTLTMAGVLPAIAGGAALAVGLLVYTFPAGVTRVKAVHMDVGITQTQGFINADTPDVGVGSVIATGVNALLSADATFEDYVTGQTAADCTGTVTDKSEDTVGAGLKLNEAGGVKTLHLNAADTWAASGDAAAVLSGTITIEWTFLGA